MQALKKLHKSLKQDPSIKQILRMLQNLSQVFMSKSPQELSQSKELKTISNEIEQIKLNSIEEAFNQLPPIPQITAFILKSSKEFTLAYLMIPENKCFGWHDHAKMNGISKIVSGNLIIRSLNPEHFQKCAEQDQNIFYYPIDRIRQQQLRPEGQKISIIYPDSFNIHEIFGKKQSSFLDLLIPEYPDNSCHYFKTCQQPIIQGEIEDKIKIRKVDKSYDEIVGIERLVKFFKEKQKHKVIPQP